MKKIIFSIIMILALGVNDSNIYAQRVVREGMTFKQVSKSSSAKADTLLTTFRYEDSKGLQYPIIINKQSGRCWIWRKSNKTGKMYKSYLSEDICKQVCKELGIQYTPSKRK